MFREYLIALCLAATLVLSTGLANADGGNSIFHSDPEGDVGHLGMNGEEVDNVDITSLSVQWSTDTVEVKMKIKGVFHLDSDSTNVVYTYLIYIDQSGDGDDDVTIMVTSNGLSSLTKDEFHTPQVTGSGTDEMTITFPGSDIDLDTAGISDIRADSTVSNISAAKAGGDAVNEDYGSDDGGDDGGDDEPLTDPLQETATDTSISVVIEHVDMVLDKGDETFEMTYTIDGKTTGNVLKCMMTMVTYYKNGTVEVDEWMVGPETNDRMTFMGMTFESYFKGTGPGGDDDWSTWKAYTYVEAPMTEFDEMGAGDIEGDNVSSAYIVVRAISDEEGTKWNQDSKDLREMLEGEGDEEKKDSPSVGLLVVVGLPGLIAIAIMYAGRRKRM